MFSTVRSVLTRVAVTYLVGELLEIKLNVEDTELQEENESSIMLISCKWSTSIFSFRINDSSCNCLVVGRPVWPQMLIKATDKRFSLSLQYPGLPTLGGWVA